MKMSLKKTHPFIALELYAGRLLRLLLKKKKKKKQENVKNKKRLEKMKRILK